MDKQVMCPIGWESGQMRSVEDTLGILEMEMLGHRSDLLSLRDKASDPEEFKEYQARADMLEKYAVAVTAVHFQVRSNPVNPRTVQGFVELADKHQVRIPDWLRIQP
jgi:hypothetical protein